MSSSESFRSDPFAQPFHPIQSNPAPVPTSKKSSRRPGLIFVLFSLVSLGLLAVYVTPTAIALWHVADARNSIAERKDADAIKKYDTALQGQPSNIEIRLERLRLLSHLGEKEKAKEDLEAVEKFFAELKQPLSVSQLALRAQFRQYGGAYRSSLADQKAVLDIVTAVQATPAEKALHLNNHAYAAALATEQEPATEAADKELLEKVLADCDESLKLAPDQSSTLDTRGCIYYLLGDTSKSIADLDRSITLITAELANARTQVNGDPRQINLKLQLREMEYGVAVIYQHRMKAHQKAGNDELSKKDRQAIIDLGYKPEVLLK